MLNEGSKSEDKIGSEVNSQCDENWNNEKDDNVKKLVKGFSQFQKVISMCKLLNKIFRSLRFKVCNPDF